MKNEKKYYSIREVSRILNIKEHVIRHWDSIDPKTNKLRIENLSIRTKGGTRFFNKSHIKKLSTLQNLLKENGKRNYSLDLASKIISQDKNLKIKNENYNENKPASLITDERYNKIRIITNNLKSLIKKK
tara:strand:- start:166 stop:555 length:390 start_codon:yes stop_codon:yes gene_type:complete